MVQHNSSEDIDLGIVFNRVRDFYHSFLVLLYKGIRFILKNVILIVVLILIGIALGYFADRSFQHNKESNLIVQINFEGGNYIYSAIDQLQNKIKTKDTVFLRKIGLYENGEALISEIEISPIVSITEILKKTPENDRNVDLFLQQAQYEDQLLTSEIFIPEYRTHRIELVASESSDYKIIDTLLEYLNDNTLLQESKKIIIASAENKIRENLLSVAYIDSVAKNYGSRKESQVPGGQIYVNTMQSNIDYLHMLFREKGNILEEVETLKIELLKYGEPVVLLNKPVLLIKKDFWSKKIIIFPVLFVLFFFIAVALLSLFTKARILANSRL